MKANECFKCFFFWQNWNNYRNEKIKQQFKKHNKGIFLLIFMFSLKCVNTQYVKAFQYFFILNNNLKNLVFQSISSFFYFLIDFFFRWTTISLSRAWTRWWKRTSTLPFLSTKSSPDSTQCRPKDSENTNTSPKNNIIRRRNSHNFIDV